MPAIDNLRKYDVSSCGPPDFYGVNVDLGDDESPQDRGLDSPLAGIYDNTLGDLCIRKVIVGDRGIDFGIHNDIQISRSAVLLQGSLSRMAPWSGNQSTNTVLPHLDGGICFGTGGRAGCDPTGLYNVPVANGLDLSGSFTPACVSSRDHQHTNSTSFDLSAGRYPGGSNSLRLEGRQHPAEHSAVLHRVEAAMISTHATSPIIHIHQHSEMMPSTSAPMKPLNSATTIPREAPSIDIPGEERLLQDIVDEALAQGV
ncbi:hypothetical protein EDB87DRAFT_1825788 [Lactarius vividus]|nr:hypothetical protein EDB87DRAFT_1825963 [Lactarius vividus]KAH9053161.1 hypothetical protein EDB87DRAFT_1825788 [Lactarius vividus]